MVKVLRCGAGDPLRFVSKVALTGVDSVQMKYSQTGERKQMATMVSAVSPLWEMASKRISRRSEKR